MIFAEINPPLSMVDQTNPFSQQVSYKIGDYMTAAANRYGLGETKVNFTVLFGSCTIEESGEVLKFEPYHRESITLEQDVIETWGQDDSVILEAIAAQKNLQIESVISGSFGRDGMLF